MPISLRSRQLINKAFFKFTRLLIRIAGTLTRCIDSLEQQDKQERETISNGATAKQSMLATAALRQILNAAYQVNVQINPGNAFMRSLVDKMKQVCVW